MLEILNEEKKIASTEMLSEVEMEMKGGIIYFDKAYLEIQEDWLVVYSSIGNFKVAISNITWVEVGAEYCDLKKEYTSIGKRKKLCEFIKLFK